MNLNVVNVVVFGIGAILVYAAVKDVDPRAVVKQGLGGAAPVPASQSGFQAPPATFLQGGSGKPSAPVVSV